MKAKEKAGVVAAFREARERLAVAACKAGYALEPNDLPVARELPKLLETANTAIETIIKKLEGKS